MHLNLVDYFYNCGRFEDFKLCNFENVISKVSGFLKENGDKRFVGICFLFKKSCCTELISFILCKISDLFDRLNKISFVYLISCPVSKGIRIYGSLFREVFRIDVYSAYESLFGEI